MPLIDDDMEHYAAQRKAIGLQGTEGAAVEDAKLMVQAAVARNGVSLLPGLGELLQQLVAARAAGAMPVQNGSSAAGHGLALATGHSLPRTYGASTMAAAAQGLASPQAEAQRGGRRVAASLAPAAGSSKRGPPPTPPGTPDMSALQPEPVLPCAAGAQACGTSPQPLAADTQLCAAPPRPPPPAAAVQHPATVSSHSQPASQLHADAKVFTPRSATAAAAAAAAVAEPAASAAQLSGHDGGFLVHQEVREVGSSPHSPPPSPCSPLTAVQPPSPAPAGQQDGHATRSAAYASALVLQAAAAASQVQFNCRGGGGFEQLGSCAPDHPASSPSCNGVPLKQGVHCSISMAAEALMSEVRCGLTQQVMSDPVTAADGCNYERGAIEAWIAQQLRVGQQPCSPVTCQPLDHLTVCPNGTARMLITSLRAAGLIM